MNSRGLMLMSQKEIQRCSIIKRVCEGELTQVQASKQLKLSLRQTKRLCKTYRKDQEQGLISKKRGKTSNRKLSAEIGFKIKALASTIYAGFVQRAKILDHFFEKLRYKISVMFMLKFCHGTAWEGNGRDVIFG